MPEKPTHNHNVTASSYPRGETGDAGPTRYGYIEDLKAATAELASLMAQMELGQNGADAKISQLREGAVSLHEAYYAGESIQSLGAKTRESVLRGVEDMLLDEDISDIQLKECLDLAAEVTRYAEAYKPWNMLRLVDRERLKDGAGSRLLEAGARSAAVKHGEARLSDGKVEVNNDEYTNFIKLANYACGQGQFGAYMYWRQGGKVAAPPFMERLVEDERFLPASIEIMKDRLEQEHDPMKRDRQARAFEHHLLREMIGVPQPMAYGEPDMVNEFKVAFASRSMKKDRRHQTIPYEAGGGINFRYWTEKLQNYARGVESIGVEQAVRLRKELGFVNFDRYDERQLGLMADVLDGKPEVRERLQNGEVTVLMTDSDADHNGFNDARPEALRNVAEYDKAGHETGDTVLYAELNRQSDIYRHMIKLHRACGARPSNLVISAHGSAAGGMRFAARETGEQLTRETVARMPSKNRFFEKYMQPGKETGVRNVVALSCSQAVRPDDSQRLAELLKNKEPVQNVQLRWEQAANADLEALLQVLGKSMLDVAAETTDPDARVSFNAAPFVVSYSEQRGNLYSTRHENGVPVGRARTLTARHLPSGIITRAETNFIPLNKSRRHDDRTRAA